MMVLVFKLFDRLFNLVLMVFIEAYANKMHYSDLLLLLLVESITNKVFCFLLLNCRLFHHKRIYTNT